MDSNLDEALGHETSVIHNFKSMSYWKTGPSHDTATVVARKFHNWVKMKVISQFASPAYKVLELAAGRGTDVHKHISLGASTVLYVDSDEVAMDSFRRSSEPQPSCPVHFCLCDLTDREGLTALQATLSTSVDMVSLQFALHYFLKDESSLKLIFEYIDRFLAVGGRFIFSGVDGALLHSKLPVAGGSYSLYNGPRSKPMARYSRLYDHCTGLGNPVDVLISSIGSSHTEFLVDYPYILDWFGQRGYKVLLDQNFADYVSDFARERPRFFLRGGDRRFASLHRITVMEKAQPHGTDECRNDVCQQSH
jgi:hypothetical protein